MYPLNSLQEQCLTEKSVNKYLDKVYAPCYLSCNKIDPIINKFKDNTLIMNKLTSSLDLNSNNINSFLYKANIDHNDLDKMYELISKNICLISALSEEDKGTYIIRELYSLKDIETFYDPIDDCERHEFITEYGKFITNENYEIESYEDKSKHTITIDDFGLKREEIKEILLEQVKSNPKYVSIETYEDFIDTLQSELSFKDFVRECFIEDNER